MAEFWLQWTSYTNNNALHTGKHTTPIFKCRYSVGCIWLCPYSQSSSISILIFWKMKTFNFVKCTQHSCSIKGPWWSMCSFINCWFYWFEVKTFLHPTANLIWHKVLLFQATPLWFQGEQRGMLWSESHDYGDESAPLFSCTFVCFATANVCSIFFFFMTVSALLLRIVPNMTFKPIAQAF